MLRINKDTVIHRNRLIDAINIQSLIEDESGYGDVVNIKPHHIRHFAEIPMFEELAEELKETARQTLIVNLTAKAFCRAKTYYETKVELIDDEEVRTKIKIKGNYKIKNHYFDCNLARDMDDAMESVTRDGISFHNHFTEEIEDWDDIKNKIAEVFSSQFNCVVETEKLDETTKIEINKKWKSFDDMDRDMANEGN